LIYFDFYGLNRNQPSLFDDITRCRRLQRTSSSSASGISPTSSSVPRPDLYHRAYRGAQPARRLREYARYPLFRTVGTTARFYDAQRGIGRWRAEHAACLRDL